MSRFSYGAYDHDKIFREGELDAEDERAAQIALQRQGLTVVELKEIEVSLYDKLNDEFENLRLGQKWKFLFFRKLSKTLDVMTLRDALKLFYNSAKDNNQRTILESMLNEIELGKTLSEAMSKHKAIFSNNIIQLIVIGQRSGRLQEISEKLAEQLERRYKAQRKLSSALYYPAFVIVVAIIAIIILIKNVLPVFTSLLSSQGSSIPLVTQIFLTCSMFISENLMLIIAAIFLIIAGAFWTYKKYPKLQVQVDKFFLKMPLVGTLVFQRESMNSFGSLALLLGSGVQIDEAVGMTAAATSNQYLHSKLIELEYEVARGGRLNSNIFPLECQELITIGESSGNLVEMLQRCETLCELEVDELSGQIPKQAEIFATLLIGFIVAFMVFSVMLPILSIGV